MDNQKRYLLWATLGVILLLTVFSVYGAFLGSDKAKVFFNSIPLGLYWTLFVLLLGIGCVTFRRLIRIPALFMIHAGCIAILMGGLWGSAKGQLLQQRLLDPNHINSGEMMVLSGDWSNQVRIKHGDHVRIKSLPFAVAVDDFRIEYYEPGQLYIGAPSTQQQWSMPAEPNASIDLGADFGTVTVKQTYRNFRISMGEQGGARAYDDPGSGSNPAVELIVTPAHGGEPVTQYVFRERPGHMNPNSPLMFQYTLSVRDFISDIRILKHDQVVAQKSVEVNHPLYYAGYHFYQSKHGRDERTGRLFTVLSVVNNSGVTCVFAGYLLICLGIVWQCWFADIRRVLHQEVR